MISLFIDTSLSKITIGLVKDGKILRSISKDSLNMHSVYTTKILEEVIKESGISPYDVDKIMVVNGPGSFTGLRIGVTVAKTYGYLIKKDITPVSSLKSLAISGGYKGTIMSIIPANKYSFYVGIYDSDYNTIYDEQNIKIDKISALINEYNPYIVSNSEISIDNVNKVDIDILKVVAYYQDKDSVNCFKIVPNYLKLPQALEDRK